MRINIASLENIDVSQKNLRIQRRLHLFESVVFVKLWDLARKMRLVESVLEQILIFVKLPWASSCGHLVTRKKFRPSCHILLR